MSSIQVTDSQVDKAPPTAPAIASDKLPATPVFLLASSAGLAVASLSYSQPMLGVLGPDIGASTKVIGWVSTLTLLGYALGLLLLGPLGDRFDRRRIILGKSIVLAAALLLAASAPSVGWLLAASLAIGLTASMAQDLVPAAATLAPAAQRGKAVGTVMTGLLLGILLSRVVSGLMAEHLGWRGVFFVAAASIALTSIALWYRLPRFVPTTDLAYGALIGSMVGLWRRHPVLRRAALAQGLISVGFSAFWSTLAVMLHGEPFQLGSAAAGAFGLAGVAGVMAAPLAGRLADRRGPEWVTRLGAGIVMVSFAALCLAPLLTPQAQLWLIVGCAVGFDFGVQASLIAHQTIVYGIDPSARSRLNAVLFVGTFAGMAVGAALGSWLLAEWGWMAVAVLATAAGFAALVTRLWPPSNQAD